MKCRLVFKDGSVKVVEREPKCGDYCDECGKCLACERDEKCPFGKGHTWVEYMNENPTEEQRVKEIKERLSKITKGSWMYDCIKDTIESDGNCLLPICYDVSTEDNGKFIENAPQDIEYLLSLLGLTNPS